MVLASVAAASSAGGISRGTVDREQKRKTSRAALATADDASMVSAVSNARTTVSITPSVTSRSSKKSAKSLSPCFSSGI